MSSVVAALLLFVIVVVPAAIEAYAWFALTWWHDDRPRDPRNGL